MSLLYDVIPVTLVSGFLGSGKSTLLADVLEGRAAGETAVLVNEFGAVGLDHLLVGAMRTQTVLLDNGCLCCSVRGDLRDGLAELFSQRARGEVPPFARLVIETSGLAMPAPIIATLLADPLVRSHYALNATQTVIDAVNYAGQRDRHPEWLAQLSAADRVLVSKADLVDAVQLEALRATLATLNPAADVVVRDAATHIDDLMNLLVRPAHATDMIRRVGQAARIIGGERARDAGANLGLDADTDTDANSNSNSQRLKHRVPLAATPVDAFCLTFDEPLDWTLFTIWFTMLLNRYGERILRVKGVLWMAGCDQPAVIHAVHHLVHPVLHPEIPGGGDTRVSRLVFIAEGLQCDAIADSYRRFCKRLGADDGIAG